MLISKTIEVEWNSSNKRAFVKLGYVFTQYGDKFNVDISNAPKYSRENILLKCDVCGIEFERTIERYNVSKSKTLSYDCCTECSKQKAKDAIKHKYGVDNIFKDAKYIKSKNKEKNDGLHHTQTEKFKKENLYGEKNSSWIDGRSGDVDRRNDPKEKIWRKKVYERDSYTCQICGDSKGGNLNAHHIIPYKNSLETRFDTENGITMCTACHKEFHRIYGKIDCNKENVLDFANNKV